MKTISCKLSAIIIKTNEKSASAYSNSHHVSWYKPMKSVNYYVL